ncbi:MAG TPA: VOC family protein [Flavisolibacter sp.]|jgi:catechol 2,3-dioxygenase-like lactoylglutathione lyase family enzyme
MKAMITGVNSVSVYVLDLERALHFYVQTLGFKVHTHIVLEPGMRWVSVCSDWDPELQLMLIPVEEGVLFNAAQASKLRELLEQNIFSCGVFRCRDLLATYKTLKSRGVRFLMEPGEGFLGQYEAAFLDNSGNWFRLTQDSNAF